MRKFYYISFFVLIALAFLLMKWMPSVWVILVAFLVVKPLMDYCFVKYYHLEGKIKKSFLYSGVSKYMFFGE